MVAAAAYLLLGRYRVDLDVYRIGARALLHGQDLYSALPATQNGLQLPFTYPPVAAIAFVPLEAMAFGVASAAMTVASLGALVGVLALTWGRVSRQNSRWYSLAPALLLALLMEPIRSTLAYGQINLLLMLLVCADLLLPRTPWPRGALVGIAAAIKLTPAAFVLTFLVQRRWRAAATSCATFVAVTAAAGIVAPSDSHDYWTRVVWDPGRIGGATYAGNQSLKATILRADVAPAIGSLAWVGLVVVAVAVGLMAMRHAARQKCPVLVVGLNSLVVLLISPVSWTHHWVWLLVLAAGLTEPATDSAAWRPLAWLGLALALTSPMKWLPSEHDVELRWNLGQILLGNAYVLYAGAVLAFGLVQSLKPHRFKTSAMRTRCSRTPRTGRPMSDRADANRSPTPHTGTAPRMHRPP